jgi:outer membrane protein
MRLREKHVLLLPLLVLAMLLPASRAVAQTKVAVADFQEALLATAEMQKAGAELEAKFRPRQQELEKLQMELQEIQQKLQNAPPGPDSIALQNDGARKQREAQRKSEDLQADVEYERNNVLQGGAERMRAVFNKLAETKGLDLVVDINNALFAKPALDLTAEATAAYNAAHPVATP